MPQFETEAQEAEWWFANREAIAKEFAHGAAIRIEGGPIATLRQRRTAAMACERNAAAEVPLKRSA